MLKEKPLRRVLIFSLLLAVAMPLLNTLYIVPRCGQLIVDTVEKESEKVCRHIGRDVISEGNWRDWLSQGMVPDFIVDELDLMANELSLVKIKFFLADGTIVYSTDVAEIGKKNRHDYFHNIVAHGKSHSKLVRQQTSSLEGQNYDVDIAEVYVPIMRDDKFSGAFELYHDVTESVAQIKSLAIQALLVPGLIAVVFFVMVLKTLRNLQSSMVEHKQTENDLIQALDAAWKLTEELEVKNAELQTVNRVVEQAHAELQSTQSQMLRKNTGNGTT